MRPSVLVATARRKRSPPFRDENQAPCPACLGIHADRAAGGHLDHRRADRLAAAGRPVGAGGGSPGPVRQQPQAAWPGAGQL